MGWNPIKSAWNKVTDGISYAWDKVTDGVSWVVDKVTNTDVGRFIFNVATGNVPGLIAQGAGKAIDAWAPDWVKNSAWTKPLTQLATGDILGLGLSGVNALVNKDSKDTVEEIEEEVENNNGDADANTGEEQKATVDKISEDVTNEIQDADNSANLNQGDTQAEAAFKADLNVADNQSTMDTNLRNAVGNLDASSQADYLQKLGQAEQLDLLAENLKKGEGTQITNAVINGAFSDINVKENIRPTPLAESIEAVRTYANDWTDEEIVQQLASIDTIDYTYVQSFSGGDDEYHVGITAQSLLAVPLFAPCIVDSGNLLQVDIIQASKILFNKAVPALERYIGKHPISIVQTIEDPPTDVWKLLESNINLAANLAKTILHVPNDKIIALRDKQQYPQQDVPFANQIQQQMVLPDPNAAPLNDPLNQSTPLDSTQSLTQLFDQGVQ